MNEDLRQKARNLERQGKTDAAVKVWLALARDTEAKPKRRRVAANALWRLGRAGDAAEILLMMAQDTRMEPGARRSAATMLEQLVHLGGNPLAVTEQALVE